MRFDKLRRHDIQQLSDVFADLAIRIRLGSTLRLQGLSHFLGLSRAQNVHPAETS